MKCYNGRPFGKNKFAPCGTCYSCLLNRAREWKTRLLLETYYPFHENGSPQFVTLTYDEDTLPIANGVPTLRKSAFARWFAKVQRKDTGPIRHFYVGEYGSRTGRPHYHMALFPSNNEQVPCLVENWKKGFTDVKPLTLQGAGYIVGYTAKKLTDVRAKRLSSTQEPEYFRASRHPSLGLSCIPALVDFYLENKQGQKLLYRGDVQRQIRIFGSNYPLPKIVLRYLRDALCIPQTHEERLRANSRYADYFVAELEAEQNLDMHRQIERQVRRNEQTKESKPWTI